jgi:prepilin-type N-terminal cleavage/methylation domain-containing protein
MNALRKSAKGFTLAELLIALAILGVIATFTIPKVLSSATSGQNTAIAKEAASMVSGAFSSYQLSNSIVSATTPGVLTQYMNYVATDTASALGTGSFTCASTEPCLKLHNGGFLQYKTTDNFGGTTTTDAVLFNIDPDGSGTIGAATIVQYANGRLTTRQQAASMQTGSATTFVQTTDPSYIQNWN